MPSSLDNLNRNYDLAISHVLDGEIFSHDLTMYRDTLYTDNVVISLVKAIKNKADKERIISKIKLLNDLIRDEEHARLTQTMIFNRKYTPESNQENYQKLRSLHEDLIRCVETSPANTTPFNGAIKVEYTDPILTFVCVETRETEKIDLKDSPAQNALCKSLFATDKGVQHSAAEVGAQLVQNMEVHYMNLVDKSKSEDNLIRVTSGARRALHDRIKKLFVRKIELFGWDDKKITREY